LEASDSLLYHRPVAMDSGCLDRTAAVAAVLRKGVAVWRKGEVAAVARGARAAMRAALEGAEANWRSILEARVETDVGVEVEEDKVVMVGRRKEKW
jgi:hypothetical protein